MDFHIEPIESSSDVKFNECLDFLNEAILRSFMVPVEVWGFSPIEKAWRLMQILEEIEREIDA